MISEARNQHRAAATSAAPVVAPHVGPRGWYCCPPRSACCSRPRPPHAWPASTATRRLIRFGFFVTAFAARPLIDGVDAQSVDVDAPGNDPLNLMAVDGPTNQGKGDGDAATWPPPVRAYRCTYVARQDLQDPRAVHGHRGDSPTGRDSRSRPSGRPVT